MNNQILGWIIIGGFLVGLWIRGWKYYGLTPIGAFFSLMILLTMMGVSPEQQQNLMSRFLVPVYFLVNLLMLIWLPKEIKSKFQEKEKEKVIEKAKELLKKGELDISNPPTGGSGVPK